MAQRNLEGYKRIKSKNPFHPLLYSIGQVFNSAQLGPAAAFFTSGVQTASQTYVDYDLGC